MLVSLGKSHLKGAQRHRSMAWCWGLLQVELNSDEQSNDQENRQDTGEESHSVRLGL